MKRQLTTRHTVAACYIGYITQAIVNNLASLLFLTFRREYGLGLSQVTLLITVNFVVQLCVDLLSAKYVDKIGTRRAIVGAHIFAAAGLMGLGIFPEIFPTPLSGLITAAVLYAVGGGVVEVLVSPIVESCAESGKASAMSLLHSFFCWGCVLVIGLSTLLFAVFGIDKWHLIACFWALIPAGNAIFFSRVPLVDTEASGGGMSIRELLGQRIFWVLALLMVCAGASELAMSQWASAFAESALHVSKAVGDLAGPCFFAVAMGAARVLHSRLAEKTSISKYMTLCALLCIAGYVLAAFSPLPLLGLLGCGICGFAVGVMWPGSFSLASRSCPRGGTAMYALLALFGDLGCCSGPTLVGLVSGSFNDDLKTGLAFAIIFPLLLIAGIFLLRRQRAAD